MKVMVIGAGGIIGQHLMISIPTGVEAVFTRCNGFFPLYQSLDICGDNWEEWLDKSMPDVVVNLTGENSVDLVEKHPDVAHRVNVRGVCNLLEWCDKNNKHLIHVSSQAVLDPVNEYGKQKVMAEGLVRETGDKWTIIRPTFVLGIRPFPGIGRENPAERILSGRETESVMDRFFSVSFAWDVADFIWGSVVSNKPSCDVIQVGNPESMTRLSVAHGLGVYPKRISHDSLIVAGYAQRPLDTTYKSSGALYKTSLQEGMSRLEAEFGQRETDSLKYRAKEVAAYFRIPWQDAAGKLEQGFGVLHNEVTRDFNKAARDSEESLLDWYRTTDAYIWELTAYHLDKGFDYRRMAAAIVGALKSKGVNRVLCLGDGVGTLTIEARKSGMDVFYHDLMGSRTADFALSRQYMRLNNTQGWLTNSFDPGEGHVTTFDAIVSLDYLEHVPNVEQWVKAIYNNLVPGGYLVAQNAFNMGSGENGAMPMHLSVNDHFEKDWDPLLFSIGFKQITSNWYQKP